jgi:hypothetical protein
MTQTNVTTQNEVIQTNMTNYEAIGADLCDYMLKTEQNAEQTRRAGIKTAISKASSNKSHKIEFLDGWATRYQELTNCKDNVKQSRKSELKAVYEALTSADGESLAIIESAQGWHDYIKACRAFNTSNVAPAIQEARELKKLENKAIKEAKEAKEASEKLSKPLDDAEFLSLCEIMQRLTVAQIDFLSKDLTEIKKAKVQQEKAQKEAEKAQQEAEKQAKQEAAKKAIQEAQKTLDDLKMAA